MDAFYQTVAGVCFTLLALWWAVIQFRHADWMRDAERRRLAHNISFSFLFPGIMSLLSMLTGDLVIIWQAAFAGAGLLGIVESVSLIRRGNAISSFQQWGHWSVLVLYGLIVLFAVMPGLVATLHPSLRPLQVEGIMVSLLLFLGVNLAWELLAEPKPN